MQQLHFGRIESLKIRAGEPLFDPPPKVVKDIKIGDNGARPELTRSDFALKGGVVELLQQLTETGDGSIELIEIRHGLPFRITIEQKIR